MLDFDFLPYGEPENWLLAFVDVETTGLKPGYHEMIDIGIIIATLDGEQKGAFFRRIMPDKPGRATEESVACNGFSVERWEDFDALTTKEAVEKIENFYNQIPNSKNIIFCAYNEHFDHAFVDHLFRSADKSIGNLHNYTLDLPSIAWGMGIPCLHQRQLVEKLDVENEPNASDEDTDPWEHTGLGGAKLNRRIYEALMQ